MNVDKEVEELKTEIKRLGKEEADGTFTVGIQGRVWCLPLLSSKSYATASRTIEAASMEAAKSAKGTTSK
jgi:hypothetical protein